MKKRIVILFAFLLFAFSAIQAQSAWKGFFKPVNSSIFDQPHQMMIKIGSNLKLVDTTIVMPSAWKVRPAVNLSGVELSYNKSTAKIESVARSFGGGIGITYNYYINDNGVPYSPFGAGASVFFDPTGVCTIGTITALQYLNFGGGFNWTTKHGLFLIGVLYSFTLGGL
jgi:hypothetical protein